jgi:hypothetical protein
MSSALVPSVKVRAEVDASPKNKSAKIDFIVIAAGPRLFYN